MIKTQVHSEETKRMKALTKYVITLEDQLIL